MYKEGLGVEVGINGTEASNSRSLRAQSLITVRDQSHQLIHLLYKRAKQLFLVK